MRDLLVFLLILCGILFVAGAFNEYLYLGIPIIMFVMMIVLFALPTKNKPLT